MVHEMDSDELVVRIEQFAAGKGDVEVIVDKPIPCRDGLRPSSTSWYQLRSFALPPAEKLQFL